MAVTLLVIDVEIRVETNISSGTSKLLGRQLPKLRSFLQLSILLYCNIVCIYSITGLLESAGCKFI